VYVRRSPCGRRYRITKADINRPLADLAKKCKIPLRCLMRGNLAFFWREIFFTRSLVNPTWLDSDALGKTLFIRC